MAEIRIKTQTLSDAFDRLVAAIEDKFGPDINLDADYYWHISSQESFAMVEDPENHVSVGQLSDDVSELAELLDRDPEDGIDIWHDVEHLCGVLHRIASLDLPSTK